MNRHILQKSAIFLIMLGGLTLSAGHADAEDFGRWAQGNSRWSGPVARPQQTGNQNGNSLQISRYGRYNNPYEQFSTGLTPQQQFQRDQYRQMMQQWNQLQRQQNQMYYNVMQDTIQQINRAVQQRQRRAW